MFSLRRLPLSPYTAKLPQRYQLVLPHSRRHIYGKLQSYQNVVSYILYITFQHSKFPQRHIPSMKSSRSHFPHTSRHFELAPSPFFIVLKTVSLFQIAMYLLYCWRHVLFIYLVRYGPFWSCRLVRPCHDMTFCLYFTGETAS